MACFTQAFRSLKTESNEKHAEINADPIIARLINILQPKTLASTALYEQYPILQLASPYLLLKDYFLSICTKLFG